MALSPSQALPRQLPQRGSQAVKPVAKVLGIMRKLPGVLWALPLGELSPKVTERAHAVSPVVKVSGVMRKFPAVLLPLPLGEVASRSDDGEGAPVLWTFYSIYDFSVKKTAAGLIFWPFSCKLKDNHARVFSGREKPAKCATHGIKTAKNNGA